MTVTTTQEQSATPERSENTERTPKEPVARSARTNGGNRTTVRHWSRVWLGKTTTMNGRFYVNWEEKDEIEVSVQEYGDPRWMEKLQHDMIDLAQDFLDNAPPEYNTVRLRVPLFDHYDGRNHKFTLEHSERRT